MAVHHHNTRFRPVIRVFVSSTFSDMKHERNALAAEVYPRLEQLCQKNGFQFQAIDLRWGVSTEAGLDHRAMRICLEELRRSQEISPEPNFLILLGNRYGWRPLPEEISYVEFDRLATAAESCGERGSLIPGVHGKTARQVLGDWYRCDENVVLPDPLETDPDRIPLNYILQARPQDLGDGRDYTRTKEFSPRDTQDWLDVQQVLWRIINTAFPAESLEHRFEGIDWAQHVAEVNDPGCPKRAVPQYVRFQASATEQEIWCGALSATNAERHVIACFREIANRDVFTAAEMKDFFDLTDSGDFDHAAAARQTALKEAIRLRLGKNEPFRIPFSRLKREIDGILLDASEADTKAFCDAVFEHFRPIIERQIEEYWHKSKQGSPERNTHELKIEQDEHQRFGRERGGKESFVGRKVELNAILAYLQNASRQPIVVHGSSGCGKTALMWRAFEEIPDAQKPLIRLIGTTPHSSDLRGLLTSLCQELRLRNPREGELPIEIKELRDEFFGHLQAATPEQPLILFLDALDQLADADNGRLLSWLPHSSLPSHVKLVVSCLSDRAIGDPASQPYAELKGRQLPAKNFINLDALSEADARTLLFDRWLKQAVRTVSEEQQGHIDQHLASAVCRQPIYLKLLFEEIRLWHSYDHIIALGADVSTLLEQLFDRLSLETNHGPLLVDRVLGYLAASRHGLAENEILEILFTDSEYKAKLKEATEQTRHELPPNATRIPIAIWSRLRFDLAPYLTERAAPGANVLTFYHRQVTEFVLSHFLDMVAKMQFCHERLASYFDRQDYWLESLDQQRARVKLLPPTPRLANVRKVNELPWQRLAAANLSGEWNQVEALFIDLFFLEAKAEAGLVSELARDLTDVLETTPHEHARKTLALIEEAIRRDLHFIARHPTTLFQCVWNSCSWDVDPNNTNLPARTSRLEAHEGVAMLPKPNNLSSLLNAWRDAKAGATPGFRWVRSRLPPHLPIGTAYGAVIEATTALGAEVSSVVFSPDGMALAIGTGTGRVTLRHLRDDREIMDIQATSSRITHLVYSLNGRHLACASNSSILVVDTLSPRAAPLVETASEVLALAFLAGDRELVSIHRDHRLRRWELNSGACAIECSLDNVEATAAAFSSEGVRCAVAAHDGTIQVADGRTGAVIATLHTSMTHITAVVISADGQRCTANGRGSGDEDSRRMTVWNIPQKRVVGVYRGHQDVVRAVILSPDGEYVASAGGGNWGFSYDNRVHVWKAVQVAATQCFTGHSDYVGCMAVTNDGKLLASGSADGTVRLWRPWSHTQKHPYPGHQRKIHLLRLSPMADRLLTASWDNTLRLWDVIRGQCTACLKTPGERITCMDFSADGRYLVAGSGHLSDDNTVRVWDVVTGRQLECFRSRDRVCDYSCVALSPDGSRTVFGSIQGPMVVADIKSGGTWSVDGDDWWGWRRDFPGWPTCAAFSPDGQSFAFGTGGELKRERGYQVLLFLRGSLRSRRFRGEEDEARSIAFSPDNSLVACTAQDGVTRVWSVETGESIQVFEGFGTKCQEAGLTLSFSQDGKTLVRQAGDRTSIFRMENTFRTTPSLRHAEEEEREQSSRGIWRNTYELRRVSTVETMISLRATNKPVAWFPAGLKNCLTINPDSAWATTLDSQLYLLELVTQSGKNSCSV